MEPEKHFIWNDKEGRGFYPVQERDQYDAAYWQKLLDMEDTSIGRALLKARLALVEKYCNGAPVVDFGIGSGAFVRTRGSVITRGYDVNPLAVNWLISGSLWHDPFFRSADNMTFWDSLEHIERPEVVLERVESHVFVSMPVFSGREHALRSKHFRPTEHFHYFTPDGFRRWMQSLGFECLEESRMETELGREDISTFVFKRVHRAPTHGRSESKSLVRSVLNHMQQNQKGSKSSIEAHLPVLHLLAREYGRGTVVECGVGFGVSTLALLGGAVAGGSRLWSYDIKKLPREYALDKIGRDHSAVEKWKFTQKDSVAAAAFWEDRSVGLWFLDTSHRFRETLNELNTWLPKMRPDGVMCGHDFWWQGGMSEEAGVKRALLTFIKAHSDRFELHVLPHDHGLFILWPRVT